MLAGPGAHFQNGDPMTTKSLMKVAAAVVAALPCVTAAYAQEPGGPLAHERGPEFRRFGRAGPGPGLGRLAEELGLSDDQKAQLEVLRATQRETIQPLMENARQAHEAFRSALESESPEATAVGQAALAMKAAERKVRAARDAAFEEMKDVLTPEQREKLEQARPRGPRPGRRGPRP